MIVYGSTISPYVRKVVAFAREKGVDVEVRNAGMGRGGPEFEEASPFRKMPALRDPGADDGRDFVVSDSSAIVQYLEAKHPEPNLIPTDPIGRARTIWYEEFTDTIVGAVGTKLFFNRFVGPKVLKSGGDAGLADAAERDELPPLLDYLERTIPDSGFLVGDRFTLADLAVACPFANYRWVGVAIDGTRYPRTASYLDHILARPSLADLVARDGETVRRMMAA
ncbi:MAG TPA: glutathione S-transferase family protein [Sphingomonas sp.]|jgi:glutathione S-transferase